MGDAIDFEKARDRAAFEKMLERSSYNEKIKPIIREGFKKGYDQAKDRAHQTESGQTPQKIDTRNEGATGAETIQQNGKTLRARSWPHGSTPTPRTPGPPASRSSLRGPARTPRTRNPPPTAG